MDSVSMNCLICTERYRAGEYCPRILPCSHTFCSKCINKLLNLQKKKKKRKKTCPFCRQEYKAESVTDLIINRDLLEVSEKQEDLARRNPLSYPVWKETVWRDTVDYHLNESYTTKNRIKETVSRNMNTIKDLMNDIVCFKDLIPSTAKYIISWLDVLEQALDETNYILNESGYLVLTEETGWDDGDGGIIRSFEELTSVTREKILMKYVFIEEVPNILSKVMNFADFLNAASEEPQSVSHEASNEVVGDDEYDDDDDDEDEEDNFGEEVREGGLIREMQISEHQLARILNPSTPKYCERCLVLIGENERRHYNNTPFVMLKDLLCIKCCVYWIEKGLIVTKERKMDPRKQMIPYLQMKGTSSSRGFTSENVNYYLAVLDSLFFKNMSLKEDLQYHILYLKNYSLQTMRNLVNFHMNLVKELETLNEDLEIKLEELDREENMLKEIDALVEDSSNFSSAASVMKSVENVIESFVTLIKETNHTLSKNKLAMRWIRKRLENINKDKLFALRQSFTKVEESVERKINEMPA